MELPQQEAQRGIKPKPSEGLTWKIARALEREIDRITHEIRTAWLMACGSGSGLLDILKMHQLHFTYRDSFQDLREACADKPGESTLYYHMDFLQHRTLPIGPEEGGEWWYANARLSVTLLVIYVWAADLKPVYYTYCSHCLEQTPEFTVACLMDLQTRLGGVGKWSQHIMFSDVGNHFRASS